MRILLFILMLTLLPLRGWMGDAMATGMAVSDLKSATSSKIAIHSVADEASKPRASIGFDVKNMAGRQVLVGSNVSACAGHTEAANMASDDEEHCTPCAACGACHSASMSTATLKSLSTVHGSLPIVGHTDTFFSADTAAHQKPPIS